MNEDLIAQDKIKTLSKGLSYALECTLATVEHQCTMRSASMHELKRQISIAQQLLTYAREADLTIDGRGKDVVEKYHGFVLGYAHALRNKFVPDKPIKQG